MLKQFWIKFKTWIIGLLAGGVILGSIGSVIANPNPVPDELKIKVNKEDVLGQKSIGDYGFEIDGVIEVKKAVQYAYKTNKLKDKKDEVVSKRTKSSRTFKTGQRTEKGNPIYQTEIISGVPQYYKDESGEWWQAEYAITSVDAFEQETDNSVIENIIGFFGKKVLADETPFYPGGTTVDQIAGNNTDGTWAQIIAYSGDIASTDAYISLIHSGTIQDDWSQIWRAIWLFDISSISGDDIESATFSVWAYGLIHGFTAQHYFALVSSAPASNTSIVAGDYDSLGSTRFADTDQGSTGWVINDYQSWVLNSTGITFVQTAADGDGIVKFGMKNAEEIDGGDGPTWESDKYAAPQAYWSSRVGTNNDPKLVIIHSEGSRRRVIRH